MIRQDFSKLLTQLTHDLSTPESLKDLFHQHQTGNPLPSIRSIREIVEISRSILFPGYFGNSKVNHNNVRYHIGVSMERLFDLLSEQIMASLCFDSADDANHTRRTVSRELMDNERLSIEESLVQYQSQARRRIVKEASCRYSDEEGIKDAEIKAVLDSKSLSDLLSMSEHGQRLQKLANDAASKQGSKTPTKCLVCDDNMKEHAIALAIEYIASLPKLREMLGLDVKAAFDSDPAATSYGEVICCYPGVRAITNYRMAHQLLTLGVPLIPRAITELAHSETGIDIHPGANIGKSFSIDHGTGVVIGETCIIGDRVKLYQGVTLGAKSIPTDENGDVLSVARHPILEDDVVVYSNASILGRITIGKGAIIGGNVWVTEDVREGCKVVQQKAKR